MMQGFYYFKRMASEKMKKKTSFLLPFLSVVFLFASISWGEDYISKSFPPDEVLKRTILTHWKKNNIKYSIEKFLGKRQLAEDNYIVYFLFTDLVNKQQKLDSFVIFKLETNYWLLQQGNLIIVVEK